MDGAPARSERRTRALLLLAVLLLALLPRLYSAQQMGRDWYYPGSFTLVNFDEGGSCRAALKGFSYSPFIGAQTIALATAFGHPPATDIDGRGRAVKSYCHSAGHIAVARAYSALTGALTAVLTTMLAWQLFPGRPGIAPLAGILLALSGWHISESHSGTVDAPSVFFIYLFLLAAVRAALRGGATRWSLAVLLLLPALWAKYWVFALLGLAAALPSRWLSPLLVGIGRARLLTLLFGFSLLFGLVSNPALPPPLQWFLPPLFYLLLPWRQMSRSGQLLALLLPWLAPLAMQSPLFTAYTAGALEGRFGSDYGAIGWNKLLRNAVNLPLVLTVGLGLPGVLLLAAGLRWLWREGWDSRALMALLPLLAFFLYLLFLAPVTYYRHYLPLLPIACLLAAAGFCALPRPWQRALPLLVIWQAVLAWDLASDFHLDPRRRLPAWYAATQPRLVLTSYYVNPPPGTAATHRLYRPRPGASTELMRRAHALILSENWYDTAFANELNGPRVNDPRRLIKTTPFAARSYRRLLADEHPLQRVAQTLRVPTFMPELLLHRQFYGSFTLFVGDLVILRPRRGKDSAS